MTNFLYHLSQTMEPHIALIFVSMIPFVELRGGIIIGTALGLPWHSLLFCCLLGNMIPIPFIIMCGRFVLNRLGGTKLFGGIVRRYQKKIMSKSQVIQKYGPWGLILFVGIPLPGTGAWSGGLLAILMNLRLKTAVPAIVLGVVLSGVFMTLGSQGIASILQFF